MHSHRVRLLALLLAITATPAIARASAERPEAVLHNAYFTEHVARNHTEARALYEKAARSDIPSDLKRVARTGAERCRDHLAAEDFATLMPADTLVFAELRRPGELVSALSNMLGLSADSMRQLLDRRPDAPAGAMVNIPQRVALSPSLLEALQTFGGAAIGLTHIDLDGNGPPTGVLVIHHGDDKLMKGLIETAFQFAPTAQKIHDFPTFHSPVPEMGGVTGVLTEGLLIVGNDRQLVEGAARRLIDDNEPSLRSREDLQEVFTERGDRMLFALCDLNGMYKLAQQQIPDKDRDELIVANSFLDLEHLRWASLSFGADRDALGLTARVCYADDHRSIVYNMLRLPSMSRESMRYVPGDAAGLVGLGLNPALAQIAAGRAQDANQVTGFDIPREIFGNIRELCAFVVPGPAGKTVDGHDPIPNAALVIASNDVARSRALWNELLRIPGLTIEAGAVEPVEFKLAGHDVTRYFIPELGKVYLTQVDDCLSVALTRRAIRGVIEAKADGKSILNDKTMSPALARLPDSAGFVLVGHVGRLAEVGGTMGEPEFAAAAGPASQLCRNTTFWFGVGQSPTQMTLTGAIMGLPDVNEAIAMFSPLLNGRRHALSHVEHHHRAHEVPPTPVEPARPEVVAPSEPQTR